MAFLSARGYVVCYVVGVSVACGMAGLMMMVMGMVGMGMWRVGAVCIAGDERVQFFPGGLVGLLSLAIGLEGLVVVLMRLVR